MNNNPAIIKLASGEALYANQALIKFMKAIISQGSDVLVPEDSIFFFKNVKFKRERLLVSQEKFSRTILLTKATAVVINPDIPIPTKSLSLVGNKIVDNVDPLLADDIVFQISAFGSGFVEIVSQFLQLSQLSNKPKIVEEGKLLEMVNSGFVVDDTNIDYLEDLLKSDVKMACQIIDSCDITKSFPYILWLTYMAKGIGTTDYSIMNNCNEVAKYLRARGVSGGLSASAVREIMTADYLKEKINAKIIENAYKHANSSVPDIFKGLVDDVRVDFTWK